MIGRRITVSPRRWAYIRVTIKVRELDGAALLAFEAAERGWGAILGKNLHNLPVEHYPRGVIVDKGLTPGRSQTIAAARESGHRVAGICEEGLIYYSVEEYGRRHLDRDAYALLDTYFAWGRNQNADLVEGLGCDPAKIVITGNPRFDLHRPELRGVFAKKVDRIRRVHGPYILVNTKFSKFNAHFDLNEKIDAAWRKGKLISAEHEAEMRGIREFHRVGFEAFVELVGALARRHPDRMIIVRPHPSENHDVWREKIAGLANAKVIFEGNVAEWILGADISIHNNCTTGVEAYLLGKPAISYRPLSDTPFDMFLPNALSSETFTLGKTCDLVATRLAGRGGADEKDAAVKGETARRFLANTEGKLATERMMDALDTMDTPVAPLSTSGVASDASRAIRGTIRAIRAGLRDRSPKVRQRYRKQLYEGIRAGEVEALLSACQCLTGRFKELKVTTLEEDVLCVYR